MEVARTLIAFTLFSLIPISQASAVGFDIGSNLQAVQLGGQVEIFCNDPNGGRDDWALHYCNDWTLDPAEMAYLVTDQAMGATRFVLKNSDGKDQIIEKTGKIDTDTGKSKKRINLWVRTLFQVPLLHVGTNNVQYELYAGNQLKESGTFVVEVTEGEPRACYSRTFFYRPPSECATPQLICWQYFAEENYCRYQQD